MKTQVRQALPTRPTRPVLRYHGGKFRLADWIVSWLPRHRVYVEPYSGAGSVFMAKARAHVEVLNDRNDQVVNLFRILRNPAEAARLAEMLRLTPYARTEYYAAHTPSEDPLEQARQLVVKAYMGFGAASLNTLHASGFRVKWSGNCQSASNSWLRYPDSIADFCARLQGVAIENRPALTVLAQYDHADTLFYCDPPYVPETRNMTHASCRYPFDMAETDHRDLAKALRSCAGMVALSGYPSALYAELFGEWKLVTCQARIEHGQARTEGLWLNPALVAALEREEVQGALTLEPEWEAADAL